ncbi:MAG: MFS transporter [Microlunatus sp.]|nr:MFS transporter [Microlunatus sp.]
MTIAAIPPLSRDRRVQTWVLAACVSAIGDRIWIIALAWTAVRVAIPATAGLVIGCSAISNACFILIGGVIADRVETRRVLLIANAGRVAVLAVALPIGLFLGASVAVLAGVALAFGAADALGDPALGTMPRQMVRPEDLGATSAMFQLASRIARFVGAPVGGLIIATGGLSLAIGADLASFLVIGIVVWTLLQPRMPIVRDTSRSPVRDFKAAARYLRHDQRARTLTIALSGLNVFISPVISIGIAMRVHASGWSALVLGVADGGLGVGAAVGAIIGMRWRPNRPARTGFLLLAVQGSAAITTGLDMKTTVVAAATAIGVTSGLASSQLSGVFQQTVRAEFLGRVGSIVNLSDQALLPVSMAAFGVATGIIGVGWTSAVCGAAMAILVGWSASRPTIAAIQNPTTKITTNQRLRDTQTRPDR